MTVRFKNQMRVGHFVFVYNIIPFLHNNISILIFLLLNNKLEGLILGKLLLNKLEYKAHNQYIFFKKIQLHIFILFMFQNNYYMSLI